MTVSELLEAWRTSRDPKVAELIIRAEPQLPAIAAFEAVTTGGIGGVLARLDKLDLAPDPRVGRFLVTLIERYRRWETPLARQLHQRAFQLLAVHADADIVARLVKLTETKGRGSGLVVTTRWFEAEVRTTIAALGSAVPKPLEVDLPAVKVAPDEPHGRRQALYDAVYEAPDDDAARAVLADFLLQEGEPHGELIAAQLAPPTPATTKRVRALLRLDAAPFVNPRLRRVLLSRSIVFERGFVAAGVLAPRREADLDEAIGVTAWATVHTLQLEKPFAGGGTTAKDTRRMLAFLTHPVMRNLKRVGPIGRAEFVALVEHGKPVPWTHLEVEQRRSDARGYVLYDFVRAQKRLDEIFPRLERFEVE